MACFHEKDTGESAVIRHKMINGDTWLRCLRCGDTWHSEEEFKMTKKPLLVVNPTPKPVHVEGDIWELPTVNAPFMSKQWAYQGSASTPYVITHYQQKRDGAVTKDGWACSCMNFTRKTPRTECKHILKVMMKSGVKPTVEAKLAGVPDDTMKAFQKWQREQAAAGVPVGVGAGEKGKLNMFGATPRKIR